MKINTMESVSIGNKIAKGREAEIFKWKDGFVVKLFYKTTRNKIDNDIRINKLIQKSGLPIPSVIQDIEYDGRLGIVFENLNGNSMLTSMSIKPWKLWKYAKDLAYLHSIIHRKSIPKLPNQRAQLLKTIQSADHLNQYIKKCAITNLKTLPEAQQLCHGDFHPDNVVITQKGSKVIDWTTATSGNPVADVARTSLILRMGELPPGTSVIVRWMVTLGRSLFHWRYLKQYFGLNPTYKRDYEKWLLPMAIVRLADGIDEEREHLMSIINSRVGK